MSEPHGKAFLGRGWAYPIQRDGTDVAMAAYEEDVRQAILLILETYPGERVMRPDFGCGIHDLAFEPVNTTTMALARRAVEDALIRWEPRIDLDTVTLSALRGPRTRLDITIRYRVRATNVFYNLVYPFYLEEGQP